MKLLRYRGIWTARDRQRRAPKNCPRCGRRMLTRTIYYECPGCGYHEHLPTATPHRDIQPVDNLAYKHGEQWEAERVADDSAAREFALAAVPPELAREYRWLFIVGAVVYLFVFFPWGMHIWTGMPGADNVPFRLSLGLMAAGVLLLCVALIHPARLAKQIGIAVACLLIPLQIAFPYLIPPAALAVTMGNRPHFEDYAALFILTKEFYVCAAFCAWVAWYLVRERRLQGW